MSDERPPTHAQWQLFHESVSGNDPQGAHEGDTMRGGGLRMSDLQLIPDPVVRWRWLFNPEA